MVYERTMIMTMKMKTTTTETMAYHVLHTFMGQNGIASNPRPPQSFGLCDVWISNILFKLNDHYQYFHTGRWYFFRRSLDSSRIRLQYGDGIWHLGATIIGLYRLKLCEADAYNFYLFGFRRIDVTASTVDFE